MRKQTQLRALNRLVNRINDLIFHEEFIDVVTLIRKRLKLDIKKLQQESLTDSVDIHLSADARVDALICFLLKGSLITKRSAKEMRGRKILPDSGRFWRAMAEATDIDWPDVYTFVPYYYVIGGLCFDITDYSTKYEKSEFRNITKKLLDITGRPHRSKSESALNYIAKYNLEEYFHFYTFVYWANLWSKILDLDPIFSDEIRIVGARNKDLHQWLLPGVYINVTDLFLDELELYWPTIIGLKENAGGYEQPPIGRTKGTKQSRKSGLGLTWKQIREQVRNNPRELTRLENEYVSKHGKDNPRMRGKAIQNFYKQVIVHPDMLDLKLQVRKIGRPRKIQAE